MLCESKIQYEIRTTIHPELLSEDDIVSMISESAEIGYKGVYYLQDYFVDVDTIGKMKNPSRKFDKKYIEREAPLQVKFRGVR